MRGKDKILVIEDDRRLREVLRKILDRKGFAVEIAANGSDGLAKAKQDSFDIALVDLKMPGMDGMEVLRSLKKLSPSTYVIIMTAFGTIDSAVEAIQLGAFHYVAKPFNTAEILIVIDRALEDRDLRRKVEDLTRLAQQRHRLDDILGKSQAMQSVFQMIRRVAGTDSTVLITGKTGTGKELVARAIHNHSERKDKAFAVVNSSAIPHGLLESELFGYLKGAFTGALKDKPGFFHEANGGTLFLDEIGEIEPSTQIKLLRAIEDNHIIPVGATRGEKVDLRLIAATSRDLQKEVGNGSFRGDLYYRLNVLCINLPELTERKEDIPLLAEHFLAKYAGSMEKKIVGFTEDALALLLEYQWPGNVRELDHTIERAALVCDSERIMPEHFPHQLRYAEETLVRNAKEQGRSLKDLEREYICMILEKTGGNKNKAASVLGIDRRTLYRKLKEYGMQ
jgi:DNA-binding NtrC family response regulator